MYFVEVTATNIYSRQSFGTLHSGSMLTHSFNKDPDVIPNRRVDLLRGGFLNLED